MTDFVASANFSVQGVHAVYATARTTSTGKINYSLIQQDLSGNYYINRCFLVFDTSAIPDGETVLSVRMVLSVYNRAIDSTDFNVIIKKHDWSAQNPIDDGNREAAYDGCLAAAADDSIWKNTGDVSILGTYESGPLDPTWVNKIGNTYYSLQNSLDVAGTPPTDEQLIEFNNWNDATPAYRPYLTITSAVTYALTVTNGTGDGNYAEASVNQIVADAPAPGYQFLAWTGDTAYLDDPSSAITNCTMPAGVVTVTATYEIASKVKSVCGVAIANIKSFAGVAIANCKTILGVDNT